MSLFVVGQGRPACADSVAEVVDAAGAGRARALSCQAACPEAGRGHRLGEGVVEIVVVLARRPRPGNWLRSYCSSAG